MLREQLLKKEIGSGAFRWRSHEITRIEGLSDAVFGFAITLLVVSLEVPKTFSELLEAMRGFGAFAICFTLLFTVWYNQYKFFRRYGLRDTVTVVLNGALLFVVLSSSPQNIVIFTKRLEAKPTHGQVLRWE